MTKPHLFLDLDGTLTDPREGIVRCLAHALNSLNRPAPAAHELERFIGPPLGETFQILLRTTDDALVRSAIAAYRERFRSIGVFENRVYPDIPPALALLAQRGFTLSLLTSKARVFASQIVEHFGLSAYFVSVYGPELDDLTSTKVALLRHALANEQLDARAVVVVGDRKEDVTAGRQNGAISVGVTWGYGSREELETAGADHIVGSVADLVSWLETR